jgi:hypothetical protein
VPAQDGLGCDEQPDAAVAGESADERGDQCSVGPGHRTSRDAATQYGELVAEYGDLRDFGRAGSCEQSYPAHKVADHQIRQSQGHVRIMPSTGSSRTCRSHGPWAEYRAPAGHRLPSHRPGRLPAVSSQLGE